MKKVQLLVTLLTIMLAFMNQQANARIWRVNILSNYDGNNLWGDNLGGTQSNPVFSQLIQPNAYNQVQPGDSIHLEGSVATYTGVSLTKRLIIIGPGYFLPDNPNTSNDLLEAKIEYVYYNLDANNSSEGSQLIGVHVTSNYGISIANISNITIKRCRIDDVIAVGYNNADITVIGNYFSNTLANTASAIAITAYGFPANFIFNNNISQRILTLYSGTTILYSALECKNNVFDCPALTGGLPSIKMLCSNFLNNILKKAGATVGSGLSIFAA